MYQYNGDQQLRVPARYLTGPLNSVIGWLGLGMYRRCSVLVLHWAGELCAVRYGCTFPVWVIWRIRSLGSCSE
jgi:hypothetical protein